MKLSFQKVNGMGNESFVFLHGLLGKGWNLLQLAKGLTNIGNCYLLDLRNHGQSPKVQENSLEDHIEDIDRFIKEERLEKVNLIGHSFGGWVGCFFACENQEKVNSLTMLDISPLGIQNPKENIVYQYIEQLLQIQLDQDYQQIKKEIDKITKNDKILSGFFISNLKKSNEIKNQYEWNVNLKAIYNSYVYNLTKEPKRTFNGPSQIIYGTQSNYISTQHFSDYLNILPNLQPLKPIQGNHWIHYEQPQQVISSIQDFYSKIKQKN